MQYIGGKEKSGGHHIAREIMFRGRFVVEPFCGGLSVTYRLAKLGARVQASDACKPLITLYTSMLRGWEPPTVVDREMWEAYRAHPDSDDPMTAFVGFGCSRSGAWFSSFVSDYKYTKRRVPAATAARSSLERKLAHCKGQATFSASDYRTTPVPPGAVVYCDKPYESSLGYPAVGDFDHAAFWAWCRATSQTNQVLVSERCEAPEGFAVIKSWGVQSRIATASEDRKTERLILHRRWL